MQNYPEAKETNHEKHKRNKSTGLIKDFMNISKNKNHIFEFELERLSNIGIRQSSAKNLNTLLNLEKEKEKEQDKIEEENADKAEKKCAKFELQNLNNINYFDDGYEKLKKELEELKISLSNKEKEYDKKYKENVSLNETLAAYKNETSDNNKKINELEDILKKKEDSIEELKKNLEDQAKNYQHLLKIKELEIKKLKGKCEQLEYQNKNITNEKYAINNENSKLRIDINGIKFKNDELEKSIEIEKNKNKLSFNLMEKKEDENQFLINKLKAIGEFALNFDKKLKIDSCSKTPCSSLLYKQKEEEETKISNDSLINNNFGNIGIKNEALNCYMSSVLQILKNIKNFSLQILGIKTKDNIIESLQKIISDLLYSKKQKVSLYEFKRCFGNVYKRFEGRQNNDSTYFLLYLIQHIHKNLNKSENQKKSNIINYNNLELNDFDKIEFEKYLNKNEVKNNSFIYDLFYGYIMNKLFCTGCGDCKITFQSYNILDIPIMNENKKLKSLEECLNCYLITKDQKGIKGFDCSKCEKKLLSLVTCILKLPKILIINLKRVGETVIYNHEITIPFILKTKDVEKLNKFNLNYELVGFIKHYGNDKSGHNIAYSKNMLDNKWYSFNDEIVKEINEYPSTEKSFLLFYQLIEKFENENTTPY